MSRGIEPPAERTCLLHGRSPMPRGRPSSTARPGRATALSSPAQAPVVIFAYNVRGGHATQQFSIGVSGTNRSPVFDVLAAQIQGQEGVSPYESGLASLYRPRDMVRLAPWSTGGDNFPSPAPAPAYYAPAPVYYYGAPGLYYGGYRWRRGLRYRW